MQGYFALCKFCNQRCITCPTLISNKDNDWIDFEVLKNNISISIKKGMKEICLSGGEPLCYPYFNDLICFLLKTQLKVVILTNGTLLNNQKTIKLLYKLKNRLRIVTAIHHYEKDVHDSITGVNGSFEKALTNLKNLNSLGFGVDIKVILNKKNFEILKELCCFLTETFKNPFGINVCGMDFCGEQKDVGSLWINGNEIRTALNDLSLWYLNKKGRKPSLRYSEFPVCFMGKHSILHLMLVQKRTTFAYNSTENGLHFNTSYDCGPFSEKCKNCIFEHNCPGIWKANLKRLNNDISPLEVKDNE